MQSNVEFNAISQFTFEDFDEGEKFVWIKSRAISEYRDIHLVEMFGNPMDGLVAFSNAGEGVAHSKVAKLSSEPLCTGSTAYVPLSLLDQAEVFQYMLSGNWSELAYDINLEYIEWRTKKNKMPC